jgi:hypothetical protein
MRVPRPQSAPVRAHRRHNLEDIKAAERALRDRACRCHTRCCDRYFARILRNVAERGRSRRARQYAEREDQRRRHHEHARFEQQDRFFAEHPELRLPELARKPQAVRQVAGELVRDLGSPFRELWQELVDEDGPRYASRSFAKVLEAVVELGRPIVVQRLHAARADHVPVLLALRPPAPPPRDLAASVVPTALQDVEVIASGVQHYDALLGDAA